MPTAVEQLAGDSFQGTLGSQNAATRLFKVDLPRDAAQAAIYNGDPITGLPRYAEAHPTIPAMTVKAIGARDFGDSKNALVNVIYGTTNIGRFNYAEPDITGSNFVYSIVYKTIETTIPHAVIRPYVYSDGDTQHNRQGWAVEPYVIKETLTVIQAKWRIQAPGKSTIELFRAQNRQMHFINGSFYGFEAGGLSPIDNTNYEAKASWTVDPGTPRVDSTTPDKWKNPWDMGFLPASSPSIEWPYGDQFMRSPFFRVRTLAAENPGAIPTDPDSWPRCYQVAEFGRQDITGWQSLGLPPGVFG